MTLQQMMMVMGDQGVPSFFSSPLRLVDSLIQVDGISRNYGTDFTMTWNYNSFESRCQISKDAGGTAGVWGTGGGAAPLAPNLPQWHESYPIAGQQNLYEVRLQAIESFSGLQQGLNDVRWAGFPNPAFNLWRNPGAFASFSIVENPAGVAHTSTVVGILEMRRVSDQVVLARHRVTLVANYV